MSFVATFWGPMYWGFVFSTTLLGATLIQGYMYYNHYRDPLSTQAAIALLIILDLSSTAALASAVSDHFLVNFGNYSTFSSIPPAWVFEAGLTTIVTFIVQVFFATRIRIIMIKYAVFGRFQRMIPAIIACTALLALVAGIGKTVLVGTYSPEKLCESQMIIALSLEEGLGVISDLFTTCTLCYILTSTRGGLRTTRTIRCLFLFFLNRGIFVTVIQIGTLVAFVAKPASMYWAPFQFSKSKFYTNTLLAMLNSRSQAGSIAPRTPSFDRSLPLQDISSGETVNEVCNEIPDRDKMEAWPVPIALEKHSSSSC